MAKYPVLQQPVEENECFKCITIHVSTINKLNNQNGNIPRKECVTYETYIATCDY